MKKKNAIGYRISPVNSIAKSPSFYVSKRAHDSHLAPPTLCLRFVAGQGPLRIRVSKRRLALLQPHSAQSARTLHVIHPYAKPNIANTSTCTVCQIYITYTRAQPTSPHSHASGDVRELSHGHGDMQGRYLTPLPPLLFLLVPQVLLESLLLSPEGL